MTSSYRILVVGVLGSFEEVLKRWFSEWGHEARFAPTPAAARVSIADWAPDVILVDHLQTPRDFAAWWQELRAVPTLATIPTIVTGGNSARSVQHEVAGILRRPYTQHELQALLNRVAEAGDGLAP